MCREAVFISASAMCNPTAALNNRRGAACDLQMLKGSSVLFGAATLTPSHEEDLLFIYRVTEKKRKLMHGISRTGDEARKSPWQS